MSDLETEIKSLIITTLNLEEVTPGDIETDAPLFGEGLGLDSIDALELGIAISKRYSVTLDPNSEAVQDYFGSVRKLAAFVQQAQAGQS